MTVVDSPRATLISSCMGVSGRTSLRSSTEDAQTERFLAVRDWEYDRTRLRGRRDGRGAGFVGSADDRNTYSTTEVPRSIWRNAASVDEEQVCELIDTEYPRSGA